MHSFRLSLSLVLTASALFAQGTPPHAAEEPVALDHLVVTAHPYSRNQADLAQPTNVLAGTALSLRQASSLGELLGTEAGISSTYFGPGASRPLIRGLGGDRIRVLENSTATLDASAVSPDHAVSLDPLLIERVEVVRGPATLLYGNAAVGGVVNVITHRIHETSPETALNGRVETRYSSVNEEAAGGLVLEGGTGPLAWHFDAYRRKAKDVRIPGFARSARLRAGDEPDDGDPEGDQDEDVPGRIPNTALVADGAAAGLSWIGQSGYIGVSFSGHNTLYGVPAGAHSPHEEEDTEEPGDGHGEESVRIDLRQRRVDAHGEFKTPLPGIDALRLKVGQARYQHQELEGGEVGTLYTNRGYDGRLEILHSPVGVVSGALGAQMARSRFNAMGEEAFLPANTTTNRALFLFEEADLSPVRWQVGARIEEQNIRLRDGSGERRDDTGTSLSTGLVWALNDTWTLGSSLARTQRAPNAQELYSDGPHLGTAAYEIGDPSLDKETSLALDVSLRKRAGFVTGALTVFASRFDGYIYEQATGEEEDELDVYAYVQRDARFHGAELESVFHLHESDRHQFDLIIGGDLVRGRNRDDGENLPRLTPRRARAGITWTGDGLTLGAEAQRVSGQSRVAPFETSTAGYTLVNAHAGYRFTFGRATCDLFVRGGNLADREARVHTSFLKEVAPLPGRNVTVGFRTSF